MAKIKPFKGLLYNSGKINSGYSSVVAPPYDVISECMRDELYQKNPYNVIKLILGKSSEKDTPQDNKYIRAERSLDQWQDENILVRDNDESFYVYSQEYECKGKQCRRIGFLGLMKIEESKGEIVLPHEKTHSKPKEDRMNLIKRVKSNLSPIFTLVDDETGVIDEELEKSISLSDPVADVEVNGQRHKLWRLSDEASINAIISVMKEKKVFIADGHHRYEVASSYRNLRREEKGYDGSADYVMMYFANMADRDNLTVMATHRVIKDMSVSDEKEVAEKLSEYFDIVECASLEDLTSEMEKADTDEKVFGYFAGKQYLLIKAKDPKALSTLMPDDKSEAWKQLDVSVLHAAIFDKLLSINNNEGNITYVRDSDEADEKVADGSHVGAFFMNPTRVEQLKAVAELGEMMPQKSTYFYPKLLTGLVINKF